MLRTYWCVLLTALALADAAPWVVQSIKHWPTSPERQHIFRALRHLHEDTSDADDPSTRAPQHQEGYGGGGYGGGGYGLGGYGYGGNLSPFGGANANAGAVASSSARNEASSLNKANAGTSAEKKADQSDIFYEKLIIFKKSHNRVKEAAASDQNHLNKNSVSQSADQLKLAQQSQNIN